MGEENLRQMSKVLLLELPKMSIFVGRALTQVLVDINRSYMYRWCLVLLLSTVSRGEDMYRGVPELVPDGASSISPGL